MRCRVVVKTPVEVLPGRTGCVEVEIPGREHLAELGLIEPHGRESRVLVARGIVQTRSEEEMIRVVNVGDKPGKLHPNQRIGICDSFYEAETSEHPHIVRASIRSESDGEKIETPEHL